MLLRRGIMTRMVYVKEEEKWPHTRSSAKASGHSLTRIPGPCGVHLLMFDIYFESVVNLDPSGVDC